VSGHNTTVSPDRAKKKRGLERNAEIGTMLAVSEGRQNLLSILPPITIETLIGSSEDRRLEGKNWPSPREGAARRERGEFEFTFNILKRKKAICGEFIMRLSEQTTYIRESSPHQKKMRKRLPGGAK